MPKKPVTKTKNVIPIKTAAKNKMKKKMAATKTQDPRNGGMWKILEMKKAQQKQSEQARSEGRSHQPGASAVLQPFARNTRFTKFAGPRRKAG
jgi:hypothetical protein